MKIGIIGGGAAGLGALRRVLDIPGYAPILWEHSSQVGGTWVFTPETGKDKHGYPIHSSMYSSLRTNIPKEVMAFGDFPFKESAKSYVHHSEVLQYLNDYADHFSLRPWIKFQHHVCSVEKLKTGDFSGSWEVTVKNLANESISTTICDVILVCNGHYAVPKIPEIQHIKEFKGLISHSHDYRYPEPFKDRNVVVLGAAASGVDISLEIAKIANKVYLSHNFPDPLPSELPSNMTQVKGVKEATSHGFILMDGSTIEADDLVCCTGYEFTFPFLNSSCGVVVEDNQVKPLYKHIINSSHPTMAFIGIAYQILPFPVFDLQMQFFLKTLAGDIKLPSKQLMDAETQKEYDFKIKLGFPARHFHRLGSWQWEYIRNLQELGKLEPLPSVVEAIYRDARARRKISLTTYKDTRYTLTDRNNFELSLENGCNGSLTNVN